MAPLPGSHLLAALHRGMERKRAVAKVVRAARKQPQHRTGADINAVAAETAAVHTLVQHGASVHRDLCHVVQACALPQMAALRLPGAEYATGVCVYVLQGRLQVRTRSREALEWTPAAAPAAGSGSTTTPAAGASEAELRALFASIDVDGSGAIDVEELQFALASLGIQRSAADVEKLMASVDEDGSGELEFAEFKLILAKMGVGGHAQAATWQQQPDGGWLLAEVPEGCCLGEAALAQGLVQDGTLVALEDSTLLTLCGSAYAAILASGFDGQLNSKAAVLRACPVLAAALTKTDWRALAYAATAAVHSCRSVLHAAGQPCLPGRLLVIQDGTCRIAARRHGGSSSSRSSSLAGAAVQQHSSKAGAADAAAAAIAPASPRASSCVHEHEQQQQVEVALIGPGDILSEAALLGLTVHTTSAVVASAQLSVLQLHLADVRQLMHAADLERLVAALSQREAARAARLASAACTASALHSRGQLLRDMCGAAGAAAARCGSSTDGGFARHVCSAAAPAGAKLGGEQVALLELQHLLPSSGAAAAAAIAAASETAKSSAPIKASCAEAHAVAELLQQLAAAQQHVQASHAARLEATASALADQPDQPTGAGMPMSAAGGSVRRLPPQVRAGRTCAASCPGVLLQARPRDGGGQGAAAVPHAGAAHGLQDVAAAAAGRGSTHHKGQLLAARLSRSPRQTSEALLAGSDDGVLLSLSGHKQALAGRCSLGGHVSSSGSRLGSTFGAAGTPLQQQQQQQQAQLLPPLQQPRASGTSSNCKHGADVAARVVPQAAAAVAAATQPRDAWRPSAHGCGAGMAALPGGLLGSDAALVASLLASPRWAAAAAAAAGDCSSSRHEQQQQQPCDSTNKQAEAAVASSSSSSSSSEHMPGACSRLQPVAKSPRLAASHHHSVSAAGGVFTQWDGPPWLAAEHGAESASWVLSSPRGLRRQQCAAAAAAAAGAAAPAPAASAAPSSGPQSSLSDSIGHWKAPPNITAPAARQAGDAQARPAVPRLQLHSITVSLPLAAAGSPRSSSQQHVLPAFSPRRVWRLAGQQERCDV